MQEKKKDRMCLHKKIVRTEGLSWHQEQWVVTVWWVSKSRGLIFSSSYTHKSRGMKGKESTLMEESKFYSIIGREMRKSKNRLQWNREFWTNETLLLPNVDRNRHLFYYAHLLLITLQRFLSVISAKPRSLILEFKASLFLPGKLILISSPLQLSASIRAARWGAAGLQLAPHSPRQHEKAALHGGGGFRFPQDLIPTQGQLRSTLSLQIWGGDRQKGAL